MHRWGVQTTGLFTYTWSETELDIVLWLIKSFSNEPSYERLKPVKLDQTHNIHSSHTVSYAGRFICIFTQREGKKRIFHLSADVIQAM